jgi:hypothetical protein
MGNVEKVKILFSNFFNRYTFKTAPQRSAPRHPYHAHLETRRSRRLSLPGRNATASRIQTTQCRQKRVADVEMSAIGKKATQPFFKVLRV